MPPMVALCYIGVSTQWSPCRRCGTGSLGPQSRVLGHPSGSLAPLEQIAE